VYDILEERGFEVYLVNAQHTKNLPGRKSDVQESQWLLKLHTLQDPDHAHILAAVATCHGSGDLCEAHAEGTDSDEQTACECNQRSG